MNPKEELKDRLRLELSDKLSGLVEKLEKGELNLDEGTVYVGLERPIKEIVQENDLDIEKSNFYRHMSDVLDKFTSKDDYNINHFKNHYN